MKITQQQRKQLADLSRGLAMNFDVPARDQLRWKAADMGISLKTLEAMRHQIFTESEKAEAAQ